MTKFIVYDLRDQRPDSEYRALWSAKSRAEKAEDNGNKHAVLEVNPNGQVVATHHLDWGHGPASWHKDTHDVPFPMEEGRITDVARGLGLKALKAGAYSLAGGALGAGVDHLINPGAIDMGVLGSNHSIIDDVAENPFRDALAISGGITGISNRRKVHENKLETGMSQGLQENNTFHIFRVERPDTPISHTGGRSRNRESSSTSLDGALRSAISSQRYSGLNYEIDERDPSGNLVRTHQVDHGSQLEEGQNGKVRIKDRPTGGKKPVKPRNKMEEDVQNLVNLAVESNPVEFSEQLNVILSRKASAILEQKRIEIAQNLYSRQVNLENI